MVWLIVYIVGVVISEVFFLKLESEKNDVRVVDLVVISIFSLFSWITVLALIVVYLDNRGFMGKVVIHKRE